MTARANTLTPLLWKEVRALAPTFAAALAAVLIGGPSDDYALVSIGLLGFVFGVVSLGAQTFGQEFHHRTLGLLLAQPIPRLRIYLTKFAALSITIVALTIITLPLYGERLARAAFRDTQPATLLMMATCGLFLAPCLAILCRSTLAAFVFTIAIPGLLAISGDLLGTWIYGLPNAAAIDAFKADVFWRVMLAICGLASIASWWLFGRLEVIEGHREIALPDFLTFRPRTDVRSRRIHPITGVKGATAAANHLRCRASLCGDDGGASVAEQSDDREPGGRAPRCHDVACWTRSIADRFSLECPGTASRHAGMASAAAGVGVEAVDRESRCGVGASDSSGRALCRRSWASGTSPRDRGRCRRVGWLCSSSH